MSLTPKQQVEAYIEALNRAEPLLIAKARRERIATAALVGLLAGNPSAGFASAAEEAVGHADALIAELEK